MQRDVMWQRLDEPGLEHLQLIWDNDGVGVGSVLICVVENTPLSLRYQIYCNAKWQVLGVNLQTFEHKGLSLQADGEGHWTTGSGATIDFLDGCVDVDLAFTPFTNTLPIKRLKLQPGESADIAVAYILAPELSVQPSKQRYTCLDANRYRFESLATGYTADLTVDEDGLVIEYPDLWKRVWQK